MSTLQTLRKLIQHRTISSNRQICQELVNSLGQEISNSVVNTQNGAIFWGHTNLSTTKWLINTHLDVVPGKPEQFQLKVNGDKGWGRGVADVKGCAAILISSTQNWAKLAIEKRLTFMFVTDEEIGGQSTKSILKEMSQLEGAIFLEPSGLHLTTQAKGVMQIQIIANGVACHGSRPWDGANSIEKLSFCLTQFRLSNPTPRSETKETTFNFSQINGGTAINQVPSTAELWCDVRFNPLDEPAKIAQKFSEIFSSCQINIVKCESPINCDKKSELFRTLSQSLKANSINPLTQFDHGTSDARHATALGIPAIVFGPKGGNLHADKEWVSLKTLEKVKNVLDHWIKNI